MLELKLIDPNKASITVNDMTARKYTEKHIRKNADYIDWKHVSEHTPLDVLINLIEDFNSEFDWTKISSRRLYEEFIYKSEKYIDWSVLNTGTHFQEFSDQFFIDFKDKIKWGMLSFVQYLSDKFIEKHKDNLIWKHLAANQKMSDSLLRRNINKINENNLWSAISRNQELTECFLDDFSDFVDWKAISIYNDNLSVSSIRKHIKKLNLIYVLIYVPLKSDAISEIIYSPEFEFQIKEGVIKKDNVYINFAKHIDGSGRVIEKDQISEITKMINKWRLNFEV